MHTLRIGTAAVRLGRAWAFTATELSRAAALLELAAQLAMRAPADPRADEKILLLRDGSEVRLRPVNPSDAPLVAALHARCSPAARRSRFLSPTPRLGPGELDALLGVPGQAVLALTSDGGSAVAVANLDAGDSAGPGVGRCSVLVDNAWQGRGLGTALVRRMAELATDQGLVELTGRARTDDLGVTQLLRRAGLRPTAEITDGVVHLRAPLLLPSR